ncbi:VanZ family protein [Brevibacillus agri]|uniref:VanZ family protein n=1 Tax=Brevibacillus TaxID=55080 RepID=UPI001ED8D461|nr:MULTISPECIES: VanZ family protein [Brevibacillus]MDN4095896.1 VanZ family protein [Brevibacillus agri]MED1645589.1 VanZ family protein [Brevibacillus agri]MED1652999.1 VanZ family protein [Brevibacillus agri]MED1687110.1 VanZ family protein [Brevibacillus agri]MED1695058.1 VanZ family protein [Brevibacillus agri]
MGGNPGVRRYRKLLDYLLLAAILVGLFLSSSQPYYKQDLRGTISKVVDEKSWNERMEGITIPYAGREISVENKGAAGFIEFFLRKGTHFTVFALLAFSFYRVFSHRLAFAVALPWSAFCSLLAAVLDEWHQTFTPDRTGMVNDVLLDLSGSVTMLLIILLNYMYSRRAYHYKMK